MKVKLITTVSDNNHFGFKKLEQTLNKFGWDWEICGTDYLAFGSKMVNSYLYAKQTDCTHLFIVDAYDVIVSCGMEYAVSCLPKDSLLFNSEKNAWPYEQWALLYPSCKSPWRYLNGGVAFVEVKRFIQMFEENPINDEDNDQVILAKTFLTNAAKYNMLLDTNCNFFQTLCGLENGDISFDGEKIKNLVTGTEPFIFHGNGRHPMKDIYDFILK